MSQPSNTEPKPGLEPYQPCISHSADFSPVFWNGKSSLGWVLERRMGSLRRCTEAPISLFPGTLLARKPKADPAGEKGAEDHVPGVLPPAEPIPPPPIPRQHQELSALEGQKLLVNRAV